MVIQICYCTLFWVMTATLVLNITNRLLTQRALNSKKKKPKSTTFSFPNSSDYPLLDWARSSHFFIWFTFRVDFTGKKKQTSAWTICLLHIERGRGEVLYSTRSLCLCLLVVLVAFCRWRLLLDVNVLMLVSVFFFFFEHCLCQLRSLYHRP